jgi:hypothetical protein
LKDLVTVLLYYTYLRSWLKELVTVMMFYRVPEELVEGVSYCDDVL